jgi:hypothetical protein
MVKVCRGWDKSAQVNHCAHLTPREIMGLKLAFVSPDLKAPLTVAGAAEAISGK